MHDQLYDMLPLARRPRRDVLKLVTKNPKVLLQDVRRPIHERGSTRLPGRAVLSTAPYIGAAFGPSLAEIDEDILKQIKVFFHHLLKLANRASKLSMHAQKDGIIGCIWYLNPQCAGSKVPSRTIFPVLCLTVPITNKASGLSLPTSPFWIIRDRRMRVRG